MRSKKMEAMDVFKLRVHYLKLQRFESGNTKYLMWD
jgi:hypothetical protein